ncbi:MAG: hypothetical protein KKG47_02565 [Proteobacteria bacterium]|nr:hypothetical protein [Pseudomonadota bacterium]MBU1738025.1 hypothetical protein [Pseudomonadota bacterium]
MNANTKTRTIAKDVSRDAVDTFSRATMIAMGGVSGLVGLWAVACFANALLNGPAELVRGFVTALTGI